MQLITGRIRNGNRARRYLLLLPLALIGLLGFTSSAQAAFGLSGLVAAPTNTDAGAKSNFHTHLDITTPADQLRDLTLSLPPGLSGNPQSVAKCPVAKLNADACPSDSQVGTTSVAITAASLVPLTVTGSVYNVVPQAGEPARLGIVLRPPDPTHLLLPPIIQQVAVKLRPDFGLDTILTDLPQNAKVLNLLPVPIAINSVDLSLDSKFMQNPTSCGTQTTGFSARSWAEAAGDPAATGSASYNSTNCSKQTYKPNASLVINGDGKQLVKTARPTVTSTITQTAGEANNKRAAVLLPAGIGIDGNHLAQTCLLADFQAGKCAAPTQVGNATAVSPLLDSALNGPVYLVAGATDTAFPQVGVDLKGTLPLKILGSTALVGGRLQTIFDGLPDLPLSRFQLSFPGGTNSLLRVVGDVCSASTTFNVDFTSQANQQLSKTLPVTSTGCPSGGGGGGGGSTTVKKPQARIRVRGSKHHRPRVSIRVKSGGARMKTVKVKLPKALALSRKAQHKVVVKAGGKRIRGKKHLVAKGKVLKVSGLPGKGANVITASISRKAIKHPRKVRRGKKLAFHLKVVRVGQKPVNLTVRTKARR